MTEGFRWAICPTHDDERATVRATCIVEPLSHGAVEPRLEPGTRLTTPSRLTRHSPDKQLSPWSHTVYNVVSVCPLCQLAINGQSRRFSPDVQQQYSLPPDLSSFSRTRSSSSPVEEAESEPRSASAFVGKVPRYQGARSRSRRKERQGHRRRDHCARWRGRLDQSRRCRRSERPGDGRACYQDVRTARWDRQQRYDHASARPDHRARLCDLG
jgi:hypothetical protein